MFAPFANTGSVSVAATAGGSRVACSMRTLRSLLPLHASPAHAALLRASLPARSIARCMAAQQLRVEVPPEVAAAGVGASPEGRSFASLAAGERTLPRASVVIHGGDLCYPSPTGD